MSEIFSKDNALVGDITGWLFVPELDRHVPVLRAFINPATTGNREVVAAQVGKKIRVISAFVMATIANTIHFRSANSAISMTAPLGANGGFVLVHNPHGWFETAIGDALNTNMSVATATGVQVTYIVI